MFLNIAHIPLRGEIQLRCHQHVALTGFLHLVLRCSNSLPRHIHWRNLLFCYSHQSPQQSATTLPMPCFPKTPHLAALASLAALPFWKSAVPLPARKTGSFAGQSFDND